ncbi:MAG TPA: tetratricopeptide repeat protein, partial [Marinilabiliaceae bacterium]|nr:tetratricopeptide repeat protein [Marinilabiliaceae bacterium]
KDSLDYTKEIFISSKTIAEDEFLFSEEFENFKEYKTLTSKFKKLLWDDKYDEILDEELMRYETLNPNYFYTYYMLGECFAAKKRKNEALKYYERALQCEVSRSSEKEMIEKRIVNLNKDLKKND